MSPVAEQLYTGRLVLERLVAEHEPELAGILQQRPVAAMLTDDGVPPSLEEIHAQHVAKIEHWERFRFGLWAARERRSGRLVGRGGLQHAYAKGVHEVEAAWTIAPERWGEGFATEIAYAAVATALDELALPRVVALTTALNTASRRVMEKAGFRFERTLRDLCPPLLLYVHHRC